MNLSQFKTLPIIGILRGIKPQQVKSLLEAVVDSGLKSIEITMNTENASDLIRQMVQEADGRIAIGAGTVLSLDDAKNALDAGATFIVMPTLVKEVMEHCVKNTIPVFPGALTPQEIFNAWQAGATMVKVFPAKVFGPSYFKELRGPFSDIQLLACGGVNADNIQEYFACGASAAAFGGSIFRFEWLANGQFDKITKAIQNLVETYHSML